MTRWRVLLRLKQARFRSDKLSMAHCPVLKATKLTVLALLSGLALLPLTTAAATWLTDLPAAQAAAKAEKKIVLLDFTGSDWCGWCIRLKNEVFSQPEFDAFANANLVLVEVD